MRRTKGMPFVNPTFTIRCPYCRYTFHPGDAIISSLAHSNTVLYTPPKHGSLKYYLSRVKIEELSGTKYTTEMARRVCPSCHRLLPEHEMDRTLNIAIVGDTSSGKTHFIAVLIDQLKRGLLMQAGNDGMRLISLSPETDRKYMSEYYTPILQNRDARMGGTARGTFSASGTPVTSDPLIYQLMLHDNRTNITQTVNLLLYDIAGEEIADSTLIVQFGEHILRADAIIYLADPMTIEKVREQLPSHLQPGSQEVSARSAHEVLANVMYRFEQYQRIAPGTNIEVPTAIMLSKSDLLKYTLPVSQHRNYLIFQPETYDGKAHPQELARLHQEVESCLRFYGEQALLQVSSRFTQFHFFAVSATGAPPDGNGKYIHLEPLRCLDPFVWILWKLGYIEAM
jgi:GTPase SAR1 family protein